MFRRQIDQVNRLAGQPDELGDPVLGELVLFRVDDAQDGVVEQYSPLSGHGRAPRAARPTRFAGSRDDRRVMARATGTSRVRASPAGKGRPGHRRPSRVPGHRRAEAAENRASHAAQPSEPRTPRHGRATDVGPVIVRHQAVDQRLGAAGAQTRERHHQQEHAQGQAQGEQGDRDRPDQKACCHHPFRPEPVGKPGAEQRTETAPPLSTSKKRQRTLGLVSDTAHELGQPGVQGVNQQQTCGTHETEEQRRDRYEP